MWKDRKIYHITAHLAINPSIHPSIPQSICPSIHTILYPPICLSVHPSIYLFIHPSIIHPTFNQCIHPSIHMYINSFIHLSILLSIHPFIQNICPSIHPTISMHPSLSLTRVIWSAICRRPSSSLLIWAACSSGLSSWRKTHTRAHTVDLTSDLCPQIPALKLNQTNRLMETSSSIIQLVLWLPPLPTSVARCRKRFLMECTVVMPLYVI